ncbi:MULTISPECIES: baseplate multidomain protein megatron [unclassified Yoonia]|uniref:baseplate multidomain protein megatron n=1 Tax=unclassified Yoonia TaxID=2629118 RepID=UPI002AFE05B3|nr:MULTISPECIES: glycoside hydrolase/phage tail family protein [unclassified Yoonia]
MATIVLSAAGLALGGSIGGSVMGLSMAVAGRAAGAMLGARIDQRLLGAGSDAVETGRVDRFRLTGAAEGADIGQVYGRMRVGGQVIWASHFRQSSRTSGGGKGAPRAPQTTEYSYSVSFAVALCQGPISRVGRIWADGVEIAPGDLNMRVYHGSADQLPDPCMSAIEAGQVPAYRGTAYVVIEDQDLGAYGNRIPQLTFEVVRAGLDGGLEASLQGVALIPGTGEYALATTPVYLSPRYGERVAVNMNAPVGQSDYSVAMEALQGDLPRCTSVVLVVSWFGDDLRCGSCQILPKVEQKDVDAAAMPWRVSGISRSTAQLVPYQAGQPVYGGTPADAAVVEAIMDQRTRGIRTVFYPFILMTQLAGNDLPDPATGALGQPALPWRGRITSGAADRSVAAEAEVAAFMGHAARQDFAVQGTQVSYTGPVQGGYRRFILHYAHLCAAAGGVDAFCIGSEMRGFTQIRGVNGFPAVAALRALAADVRAILGPDCKISYAADWTEYHGLQPAGTADKLFHLDPLWADTNIDFIGIDNYMPLADWRDGESHADASAGSIHDLAYLRGNIAGGEGYDWYYPTPEARDAQRRVPITDGLGEPWVWRVKDIANWWGQAHHDRIGGVRQAQPTAWVPQSKPIWFTEFGCAAVDKGANQPNRFVDAKSSESGLPHYSNGNRDDLMQMQYLRAMVQHYADPACNPTSALYGGPMVDTARMHVWAWDARPYPAFPANRSLWADAGNYARGHWLNGRASNLPLSAVVAAICDQAGIRAYDVSRLFGIVRGYHLDRVASGRAALQPLMLAYGFDAVEKGGVLVFRNRAARVAATLRPDDLALDAEQDQSFALTRAPLAQSAGRVEVLHLDADADYEPAAADARQGDGTSPTVARNDLPLALTRAEGRNIAARWLQEALVARDTVSFALPPSRDLGAGDVVALDLPGHEGRYRIDRVEDAGLKLVEAVRVSASTHLPSPAEDQAVVLKPFAAPVPVELLLLDLPLLRGDEWPHAPHLAVAGAPWPGSVAVYSAAQDSDYVLSDIRRDPAVMGESVTALPRGRAGIWDRQAGVDLRLISGTLQSVTAQAVLAGANMIAIGDGSVDHWEVLQFRDAVPLGGGSYRLHGLLRGQAGSRGIIPDLWPAGAKVVLLDGRVAQMVLPSRARGLSRHVRYGPAKRPLGDPSFRYRVDAFAGNGLRPFPVAHLRMRQGAEGLHMSWIRCGRIDGDLWADGEIPLGEAAEIYDIRVLRDGIMRRQARVTSPIWHYPAAQIATDHGGAAFRIEVAQVSESFGPGPYTAQVLG